MRPSRDEGPGFRGDPLVAAGRDSGIVHVFDVETLHLFQRIPVGESIRDLAWLSDTHLLATPISGPGGAVTTDVDELLEVACSRTTRTCTSSERAAHHLDPCQAA